MKAVFGIVMAAVVMSGSFGSMRAAPAAGQAQTTCAAASPRGSGSSWPLVAASDEFGFRLLSSLARNTRDNVFISPISVALALDMTWDGARGGTQGAMARALGLQGMGQLAVRQYAAAVIAALRSSDPKIRLEIANSLWARSGVAFRPSFLADAAESYGAKVSTLDFRSPRAASTINAWVSCATHGTIPSVIDQVDPSALIYLMNATYFHGNWSMPFEVQNTHPQPFTTGAGTRRMVPRMEQTFDYPYYGGQDFQAASLGFGTTLGAFGRFSMVIILPRRGLSLQSFEGRLNLATWRTWMSRLKPRPVDLGLPRITVDNRFDLKPTLSAMGMGQAFSPSANFSGMCSCSLFLYAAIHKTHLKVDEKGATAAAVTMIGGLGGGPEPPPVKMIVDRPFLLAIRDTRTGAILFLGAITNP